MNTLKLFLTLSLLVSGGMESAQACKEGEEEFWENTEHRSLSVFSIALQENYLFVYSDKSYDYIAIQIQDANGLLYYTTETSIVPGEAFVIPVQQFPVGTYQISFYTGNKQVTKYFSV